MYAQNNEDESYHKYIDMEKTDGKYIDIGAGSAIEISNTYILYKMGWKGLCVEPNSHYTADWKRERPNDILITQPIMDVEAEFSMASTVMPGSWLYEDYIKNNTATFLAQSLTLAHLLELYPDFYEVDLFSLDVELSEDKVLATANFEIFKPKLIIIEKQVRGINSKPNWEHLILPFYDNVEEFPGNTFYLRK